MSSSDMWAGMFIRKNGKSYYEVYYNSTLIKDDCIDSGTAERAFLEYRYGKKRYGF